MITFTCDKGSVKIEGNASPRELLYHVIAIVSCTAIQIEKDTNGATSAKANLEAIASMIVALANEEIVEGFISTNINNSSEIIQ